MGTQVAEKVYVAIGTDPQEGFSTLEWALRKWSSPSISIVILFLHAANNTSKDYVYTPCKSVSHITTYITPRVGLVVKA